MKTTEEVIWPDGNGISDEAVEALRRKLALQIAESIDRQFADMFRYSIGGATTDALDEGEDDLV